MRADLGSVNLVSHHLGASGQRVPVTLSASTGSVNMNVNLARQDAVSLAASTSIGSISQSLSGGFIITQSTRTNLVATAGNFGFASKSLMVIVTSNLGSVDLTAAYA